MLQQKWLHGSSKISAPLSICLKSGRPEFDPWVGKIPWRRKRLPTPVFWPEEFHGPYSPWGLRVKHDWVTFTHFWWFFCKILKMNLFYWLFKTELGEVPWWLGFSTFIVAAWVRSLVGELRFCILQTTRHSKKNPSELGFCVMWKIIQWYRW